MIWIVAYLLRWFNQWVNQATMHPVTTGAITVTNKKSTDAHLLPPKIPPEVKATPLLYHL
ncbi:hypothetical protein CSC83_15065 [Staphylococcus aureus]|nr:hypothetical protein CSC85_12270 [Staphylococcus aureus]PPJ84438.1 hypothetical protein CSC84_14015 [Staphylococcus aureus]PPJ91536.1 hypothetical protein CSC83_15065 [Staphylococcus aureus]PPJ91713.1 hypothetical protein CSC86_11915 [Staphylococcus aureus]